MRKPYKGGDKMKRVNFVLLIILLSMMWASPSMYGDIPHPEYEALQALYETTGGSHWSKSDKWLEGELSKENKWHGITCNPDYTHVSKIILDRNKLRGKLPSTLGELSNLESLVLNNNHLESTDEAMGKLKKLTHLDLSNNELQGPIPSWIGKLKNLKILNLSNNKLIGTIPPWIENLEDLEELLLDGNMLAGPLPESLGHLERLKILRIGSNRLRGKIPDSILDLTSLGDNKSNFKWNGLYTSNKELREFLKKKQIKGDWESTQTVAPDSKNIKVIRSTEGSITISWKPIKYTSHIGGYLVHYSTKPGGPYDKLAGSTDDKTTSEMEVKGLNAGTTYYFVIRTRTESHDPNNKNEVISEPGKEKPATTPGITISGPVTTSEGQGVPGVKLEASNDGGIVFTDSDGKYKLGVTSGWSGEVKPSKDGYKFDPGLREYLKIEEKPGKPQDYTAEAITKISGEVTDSKGKGVPGVTLTFSDKEGEGTVIAKTGSKGIYSHTVSYNWSGTVTPGKTGYEFEPSKRVYTGVTSALEEKEYMAFIPPGIRGCIKNRRGRGIPGVTLTFSNLEGTTVDTANTDKNGKYSKLVIINSSGSVKPSKPGYIFYPAKKDYKNMTIDAVKLADYKSELDLKFFISVTGNYMVPLEKNFEEIYGSGIFDPEIKAAFKFYRPFYLWGGYGFLSKSGESIVFEEPTKWKENFLSLGIGYNGNLSIKFGYKAEVGLFYVMYTEEMSHMEEGEFVEKFTNSGKAVGVRIDGAGIFKISDRLFTEISIGYLFASDTVDEISIKLGGLKGGVGIGFRF